MRKAGGQPHTGQLLAWGGMWSSAAGPSHVGGLSAIFGPSISAAVDVAAVPQPQHLPRSCPMLNGPSALQTCAHVQLQHELLSGAWPPVVRSDHHPDCAGVPRSRGAVVPREHTIVHALRVARTHTPSVAPQGAAPMQPSGMVPGHASCATSSLALVLALCLCIVLRTLHVAPRSMLAQLRRLGAIRQAQLSVGAVCGAFPHSTQCLTQTHPKQPAAQQRASSLVPAHLSFM
jgi:hypothetical protein